MRRRLSSVLFLLGLVLALGLPAGLVLDKELLLARGQPVVLELAPVDPRSLVQGDYMRLDYQLLRQLGAAQGWLRRGELVAAPDERGVARFVRRHTGEPLAPGELLLAYRRRGGQLQLGPPSFFFPEGEGETYAAARYGELAVAPDGESLLVRLLDEDLVPLGPGQQPIRWLVPRRESPGKGG